jgi:hypothetical protein
VENSIPGLAHRGDKDIELIAVVNDNTVLSDRLVLQLIRLFKQWVCVCARDLNDYGI